ncbi:DUF6193 family natural product biosynthesis protein [Polymorphospora rubra]|uniref:DUF6193 family natural product biosynthesis protein n=1 Tax=Polymorphospora rubra TaxID=338584 RepID=UPI00340DF710
MPDGTRQIDEIRAEIWEEYLQPPGDWFRRQTHQLLTAAAATPLRGLFPYTSHNTLHFSRCSYYPFTHDCPWIWFDSGPRFVTYEPHPGGLQGNLAHPPPPVLLATDDPAAAIAAAVRALPPQARVTWVGDIETGPG